MGQFFVILGGHMFKVILLLMNRKCMVSIVSVKNSLNVITEKIGLTVRCAICTARVTTLLLYRIDAAKLLIIL